MFLSNLSILGRKVFWLILAIMLSLTIASIHAIIRIKSTTAGGGTSCAKIAVSSGNEFGSYLDVNLGASMRSESSAETVGDGLEIITSDIFLFPNSMIVAEGHPVYISGETREKSGYLARTTIWVDENENGVIEAGETVTGYSSVLASCYLYGGSDTLGINCDKISITMTGGEIGAIFAGGYYQNVNTRQVDIKILGGSVQYVDCGSQVGPAHEVLTATDSISVLLKDCRYRSNVHINALDKSSYKCGNVIVVDLSNHMNGDSYTRHTPSFTGYVSPIARNSYVIGGKVTIPAECDIEANVLVVQDSAMVNNLGRIVISSCRDVHFHDKYEWTGNELLMPHKSLGSVVRKYTYNTHTLECSDCYYDVTLEHVWTYVENPDGVTHTRKCVVCDYSYVEPCSIEYTYNDQRITQSVCKYCHRTQTEVNAVVNGNRSCTHQHVSNLSMTKHHADLEPEGLKEYDVTHSDAKYCTDCKQVLPFTLVHGTISTHFRDLGALSRYIASHGITTAEVKMNCDAFSTNLKDTLYTSGTIKLDLNGCDMDRDLVVTTGTVTISNSKFFDPIVKEDHYANISGGLLVKSAATVSVSGCRVNTVYVGKDNAGVALGAITLGNTIVDNLYLNDKTQLTITDKVKITERLNLSSTTLSTALPTRCVVMGLMNNGVWLNQGDHTKSVKSKLMGPANSTGYVGLMPCPQHKMTTGTSMGAQTHSGKCIYCEYTFRIAHDMTDGVNYNDSLHTTKCSVCAYEGLKSYHDYDMSGKCLVNGCNHQAPVSVHGQYSALKTYFSTFDDALVAANVAGMYDTITMYRNQVYQSIDTLAKTSVLILKNYKDYLNRPISYFRPVSLPQFGSGAAAMRNEEDPVQEGLASGIPSGLGTNKLFSDKYIVMGPYIHIAGNQYSLRRKTESEIVVPTGLVNYCLEMSGDTASYMNSSKLPITVAPGYDKSANYSSPSKANGYTKTIISYNVFPCEHTSTFTYAKVKDSDGNYLAYHKKTCDVCGHDDYVAHAYSDRSGVAPCRYCNLSKSDAVVARVSWEGNDRPLVYYRLIDAWDAAINKSVEKGIECTIQVLSDIKLENESTTQIILQIPSNKNTAKIILDATDDEGKVHLISAWSNTLPVINAYYGQLTIKSGGYYSLRQTAVRTKSTTALILKGGSFASGSTNGGVASTASNPNILLNLPSGYILKNGNTVYVRKNPKDGTSSSVSGASGTVMPCPHASTYKNPYRQEPTCSSNGYKPYELCHLCGYYIDIEAGEMLSDIPVLPALGHQYDSNDICSRCSMLKDDIVYTEYAANGTKVRSKTCTGFKPAWTEVRTWATNAASGHYIEVKLLADETWPQYYNIINETYSTPVTIDLNGHNLDLGDTQFNSSNNHLTIKDSQKSGHALFKTTTINAGSLSLDGAQCKTGIFSVEELTMHNEAGLIMEYNSGSSNGTAVFGLKNATMENGCWMEGINCPYIINTAEDVVNGVNEFDHNETVVDLLHHLEISQLNYKGDWIPAYGTPYFYGFDIADLRIVSVGVASPNERDSIIAATCYRWHAVKRDVEHSLVGRYCTECNQNTHHYAIHDGSKYAEKGTDANRSYLEVAYYRSFAANQIDVWQPLYIPMSIAAEDYAGTCDVADIYSFGRISDTNCDGVLDDKDDTWLIVSRMTSGNTTANYPYLIRPKRAGEIKFTAGDDRLSAAALNSVSCTNNRMKYTFKGTNAGTTVNSSNNAFLLDTQGKLSAVKTSTAVSPLRWYMQAQSMTGGYNADLQQSQANGIRVIVFGEDIPEATALELLRGETVEIDLDGQHYTLDGRKTVNTESGIKVVKGHKIIRK